MSTIQYVRGDTLPALWVALTLAPLSANLPGDPIDISAGGVTVRAHIVYKETGLLKQSIVGSKVTGRVIGFEGSLRKRPVVSTDAPYDAIGKGGIVQFFPDITTFDVAGEFEVEYEITWLDGKKQTVFKRDSIVVRDDAA